MMFKYRSIDSKTILMVLIIFADKYIESSEYTFNKYITLIKFII